MKTDLCFVELVFVNIKFYIYFIILFSEHYYILLYRYVRVELYKSYLNFIFMNPFRLRESGHNFTFLDSKNQW